MPMQYFKVGGNGAIAFIRLFLKEAKENEMEFTLRKQWKVEKLRKDVGAAARRDPSIVGGVSTQHSNIQLSHWSAARNITKGDLE